MSITIKNKSEAILEFIIKSDGKYSITDALVNSFRRVQSEIPTYSFPINSINIKENNSTVDNDIIRQRISLIPITNLEQKLEASDIFEMHLYAKNIELDIMTVSTKHCNFYLNGKIIEKNYKNDFNLFKLKQKQTITLIAKVQQGIAKNNVIWSTGMSYYHKDDNANLYLFTIESNLQYSAIDILKNMMNLLKKKLIMANENFSSSDNKSDNIKINEKYEKEILFHNEDHTLGNLLTTYLRRHTNIEYTAYKIPHPLKKEMFIYARSKGKEISTCVDETVTDLISLIDRLERQIN